jgi:hypothetical protein
MGTGSDGQDWPAAPGQWLQTALVDLWGWLSGLFQYETFEGHRVFLLESCTLRAVRLTWA